MNTKDKGFTLIELLIAMAIASIVMAAVWKSFDSQQKSYVVQEQVSDMQQNLRAGLNLMVREIRMAGYDPTGALGATIQSATSNSLQFTRDDTTGTLETIIYSYNAANRTIDRDINGGGGQPVAENIENLEFFYTLEDGTQTLNPTGDQLPDIRRIDISILARTEKEDKDYTNTTRYFSASNVQWGPFNDGFRRRLLITSVKCRNMGLM